MIRRASGLVHADRRQAWMVAVILGLLAVLVSPDLLRSYVRINPFDEAKYIESGRLLLAGEVRNLTWGPLVALLYAPLHLLVGSSPDWFVLEASLGRIILYLGLLLSTYYLALQFKPAIGRYHLLGVLFVSTAYFGLLNNPSDALFVALSSLSLAKLLAFLDRKREADLASASALYGLAVLCRFEAAILLFPLLLAVILTRRPLVSPLRLLLASLLPAVLILAAYLLAFRITAPGSDLGIGPKSYDSFEVNQPIPGSGTRDDRRLYARSLFGTAEENRGSVLMAIRRNPAAFVDRILVNIRRLPELYLDAFGRRLGPALLLFGLWGGYSLLRDRKFTVLLMLALWGAAPLVSLAFLTLHIVRQMSSLIHILCAVGVTCAAATPSRSSRWIPLAAALLLAIYGLADQKLALVVVGVVLTGAFALIRLIEAAGAAPPTIWLRRSMLLLAAGFILRGPYPFPDYPPIGGSPQEAVVYYLQAELPAESRILESLPLPAVAAKMREIPWSDVPEDLASAGELHAWLVSRDITAVFVDERDVPRRDLVALLEAAAPSQFEIGHTSEDDELRVYLVKSGGG